MSTYKRLTLVELIDALHALPEGARVNGLSTTVDSYRGYYERNSIDPAWDNERDAVEVAVALASEEGKLIQGWKGGDYYVNLAQLVYLAPEGVTGPCIIGLKADESSGVYEPVLLDNDYHF